MEGDLFTNAGMVAVVLIYGATLCLSCAFAFSVKKYLRLEEEFRRFDVFTELKSPFARRNIFFVNDWCLSNHTLIGAALMCVSIWIIGTVCAVIRYL